jgi:uncharacterized protein with HEPN domain
MSRSWTSYLRHILDEADYLEGRLSGLNRSDFNSDDTLKRAVVRSLEVIGEAVKNLPDDVKLEYPGTDWRSIARMRDILIHHYFGVDYDIVWDAATNKAPALKAQVAQILEQAAESDVT